MGDNLLPVQHLEHLRAALQAEYNTQARNFIASTTSTYITNEEMHDAMGGGGAETNLKVFLSKRPHEQNTDLLIDHYIDDKKVSARKTIKSLGTKAVKRFFTVKPGDQMSLLDPVEIDGVSDGSWRQGVYQTAAMRVANAAATTDPDEEPDDDVEQEIDDAGWCPLRLIPMLDLCEDMLAWAKETKTRMEIQEENAEHYRDLILSGAVPNSTFEETGKAIDKLLRDQSDDRDDGGDQDDP